MCTRVHRVQEQDQEADSRLNETWFGQRCCFTLACEATHLPVTFSEHDLHGAQPEARMADTKYTRNIKPCRAHRAIRTRKPESGTNSRSLIRAKRNLMHIIYIHWQNYYVTQLCCTFPTGEQKVFKISKSFVWQPTGLSTLLPLPSCRYLAAIRNMGNMLIICSLIAGLPTLLLDYF